MCSKGRIGEKSYIKNFDRIFVLIVILFFSFWSIGMLVSHIKISDFTPNKSALLSLNIWFLISLGVFIFMFVSSMIYGDIKHLILSLIALLFIYLSISFLEPFGRTYDSYKYLGEAAAIAQGGFVPSSIGNYLVYFKWPGTLIYASMFSKIFALELFSLTTSVIFIKSFHVLLFVIFTTGCYLLANSATNNKLIALKSCLTILLFQTLITLEYSPNTITFSLIPLTIYSVLQIRKNNCWAVVSIVLILFITTSHPFNILFTIIIIFTLWFGTKSIIFFQRKGFFSGLETATDFSKKVSVFIILIFVVYFAYAIFFGSYILEGFVDLINAFLQDFNNTGMTVNKPTGITVPEIFRRFVFVSLLILLLYTLFRAFNVNKRKVNVSYIKPNVVIFSIVSVMMGIIVFLSSFLIDIAPTLALYSRIFGFFIIIAAIPFIFTLDIIIENTLKIHQKKNNLLKVKSCIIILILILIPISYYASSFTNERYFAPTSTTMKVAEFGSNTVQNGELIVDNIYPRSIYANRYHLNDVVITSSRTALSIGPDVFVITESSPYFEDYFLFIDYAENHHYSKIYELGKSAVYIKD